MTQEQKQFQSDFMTMVTEVAIENNTSIETELTKSIIEYVIDSGDAVSPEICECKSNPANEALTKRYKLNAFDYSELTGILDLFGTIYYEGQSPTLPVSTAHKMVNELSMFFLNAVEGRESKNTFRSTNPDVADVMDMIRDEFVKERRISLVRLFVLSNGYSADPIELSEGELEYNNQKVSVEYYFWDMEEVRKADLAKQNNQEIIIDLKDEYQSALECIEVHDTKNDIVSYLAIMPALVLAKIYNKHKVRLIDQNVRNFLGGKVKVNKEMAETLATTPELFFSFNNGISSTASNVTIEEGEDGRKYITKLRNWHIVNGGQTTSTIYSALKKNKETAEALQSAYVAVKVSEVKPATTEALPSLVPAIAKYANSQTKVKDSDLSANANYMLDLEKQSRKEMTETAHPTYWYFERLRGQFLTDKLNAGSKGSLKVKKFEEERPQTQRFNKTDIAKIEMAWNKKPFEACKGAEVCFDKYWKSIQDNMPIVDEKFFHDVVAKLLIYKYIDLHLKVIGNKGYAAIICNYTIALLALRSQGKLDLNYIWHHQGVQDELKEVIKIIAKEVSDYLTLIGTQGTKNPQTESKKVDFWNTIQNKTLGITIPDSILVSAEDAEIITASQQAEIDASVAWGIDNWKNLAAWTKSEGRSYLSIMEKKKIDHIAILLTRGDKIKARLAEDCQRIKRIAEDNGFTENRIY